MSESMWWDLTTWSTSSISCKADASIMRAIQDYTVVVFSEAFLKPLFRPRTLASKLALSGLLAGRCRGARIGVWCAWRDLTSIAGIDVLF